MRVAPAGGAMTTTITRYTPYSELPEWLSIEEVQAHLGIKRTLAYELAGSGKWKTLKAGRLVRVHRSNFAVTDR